MKLDLVAIASEARAFARLGPEGRLSSGVSLPPAEPVFPRYVEPDPKAVPA